MLSNYNARDKWEYDGKPIVPQYYEAQGRHYMAVMDLDPVYFCCLYGNSEDDVIIRSIDRDLNYEDGERTVNKKTLLAMGSLKATAKMIATERADVPREVPGLYGAPYRRFCQFARCRVEDGILRVALFFPDNLRTGSRQPSFEVFIDRAAEKYVTYDRMADKWRTARLDNLD